jgi:hypothetical protein
MGGLFTVLKVRDQLRTYDDDPGWFKHPPGTVAMPATNADLRRDGIDLKALASASEHAEHPDGCYHD